jgi:hypothetical protein
MKRHPIGRLVMLAAAGVPGGMMCNASAAVVSVFMQGTVESALFGADAVFPVGTTVSFFVSYEADPQINPDLDPRGTSGFFQFIRFPSRFHVRNLGRSRLGAMPYLLPNI